MFSPKVVGQSGTASPEFVLVTKSADEQQR